MIPLIVGMIALFTTKWCKFTPNNTQSKNQLRAVFGDTRAIGIATCYHQET